MLRGKQLIRNKAGKDRRVTEKIKITVNTGKDRKDWKAAVYENNG